MDELEKTVVQHTEQIRTLFSRVDQTEKMMTSINNLTLSVKELALKQGQMQKDVAGLQEDVETIKQKPAKKWEDVTSKVLWAVLAAVIGLLLGKFGI